MTAEKPMQKPHYTGHYDRLRGHFLTAPDAVPDYELLELLLFIAIPRQHRHDQTNLRHRRTLQHHIPRSFDCVFGWRHEF